MNQQQQQYERLTAGLIAQIEEAIENGTPAPWQKPWRQSNVNPHNPFTGTFYSGINRVILTLAGKGSRFATFKQIAEKKGHVKKGAKGILICYYGTGGGAVTTDENGNDEKGSTFRFLKTYYVFSMDDVEGIDLPPLDDQENSLPMIDRCEAIVRNYGQAPTVYRSSTDGAFYTTLTDSVHVPPLGMFKDSESFYGTLFHELVHSTGHESRLNRLEKGARFGGESYSKEELVAELGAMFLAHHAQIDPALRDNNAAYLRSWLKVLRAEPRLLVTASAAAQRAADWVLGER